MFNKGNPNENYDVTVILDVLNASSENKVKLNQLVSLIQMDRNGLIDVDKLLTAIAGSIDLFWLVAFCVPLKKLRTKC